LRLCQKILQWKYVELQLLVTFHLKNVGKMKNKIELSELICLIDCLNCKSFRKVTPWQDRMLKSFFRESHGNNKRSNSDAGQCWSPD
jgi:hypothetical protein